VTFRVTASRGAGDETAGAPKRYSLVADADFENEQAAIDTSSGPRAPAS
jgi:hypothetical protein